MPNCKSCGASIEWIKMESGRSMPVDAELVGSNLVGLNSEGMGVVHKGPSFMPHFATCPHANRHRKPQPQTTQQGDLFNGR